MARTREEKVEAVENPFGLTNKQRDTIQMLANGYSQQDVAKMQCVSLGSIKERLWWIRTRMGVDTTLQAVALWIREVEFADYQLITA